MMFRIEIERTPTVYSFSWKVTYLEGFAAEQILGHGSGEPSEANARSTAELWCRDFVDKTRIVSYRYETPS